MTNRFAAAAFSVAAVLGTSGGVAVAMQHHGPAHHASGTTAQPAPLLYATDYEIRDGKTKIPLKGPHHVAELTRVKDGYLVLEPTSSQAAEYALWHITPTVAATNLASVYKDLDVNEAGTQAVATDIETGNVTVWDIATRRVVATWNGTTDATSLIGWAGSSVLIVQPDTGSHYHVLAWDPATGKTTTQPTKTAITPTISPGGAYLAGGTDAADRGTGGDRCLAVRSTYLKKTKVDWHSCTYRLAAGSDAFNPDGTRLLAVPAQTDGFGPSRFVVIDASDGPGHLVADVKAPDLTLAGAWSGSNDAVYVLGSNSNDPAQAQGGWIDRCTFNGNCSRVVTSKDKLTLSSTM